MSNKDDCYSTSYVENLLNGVNEWRNIQDIVRVSIKSLCEVVRNQGIAIRDLEKQIITKSSKNELISGLNLKANVSDVMKSFSDLAAAIDQKPNFEEIQGMLDDKMSKNDVNYLISAKPSLEQIKQILDQKVSGNEYKHEISNIHYKIEELISDFGGKFQKLVLVQDFEELREAVALKANSYEVNEALNQKANKDIVLSNLNKKVNRSEFEEQLKYKLDGIDFSNFVKNHENEKVTHSDLKNILISIDGKCDRTEILSLKEKADSKELQILNENFTDFRNQFSKKIEEFDQDLDLLIENVKNEFQSINQKVGNLQSQKIEYKDIEKLNSSLNKKIDLENLNSSLSQLKNDVFECFKHYKSDLNQGRKIFEDNYNEKIGFLNKNSERVQEELIKLKEKLSEYNDNRKSDQNEIKEEVEILLRSTIKENSVENQVMKNEIQKIYNLISELDQNKVDVVDFDKNKGELMNYLDLKPSYNDVELLIKSIEEEYKTKFDENKEFINQSFKNFENEIQRIIDKKANVYDLTSALNSKVDFQQMNELIENKIDVKEFENLRQNMENLYKISRNNVSHENFDKFMKYTQEITSEIQNSLKLKADNQEINRILKIKADISDVNKALSKFHNEIELKCDETKLVSYMDNQSLINEILCNENNLARFHWSSGKLKNGYSIPWEVQGINTSPDNFIWEKDKPYITIMNGGLYELSLGFFTNSKPKIQVLINGEPIISCVSSTSTFIVHHGITKTSKNSGLMTGLSVIEFIALPEKCRISITYSGDENTEGFMGLKKK